MEMPVLDHILMQHADEAAWLWTVRKRALCAPHYKLKHLVGFDDRLDAHLDGLLVAGEAGWRLCETQLDDQGPGEMFAAAVLALRMGQDPKMDRLLTLAEVVPSMRPGLTSALGWVASKQLPHIKRLLGSPAPIQRWLGVTCASLHRIDIGSALAILMDDLDENVRIRALRAAGELGCRDLLRCCQRHLVAAGDPCRFWAAWSATILGDRAESLQVLWTFCVSTNPFQQRALQIALQVLRPRDVHELLTVLEHNPGSNRLRVQSVGIAGDPERVPWLIEQMQVPSLARLAGEAFTLITGADLEEQGLKTGPPGSDGSNPTDNPPDEDVELDPDEDLAWPDASKLEGWWKAHGQRFSAARRHFVGQPVSVQHAQTILRDGYQRQRILAALQIALLQPGAPLFEWRMPAQRQLHQLVCQPALLATSRPTLTC